LQALDAPRDGASVIYCAAPICVSVRSIQMFDLIMLAIGLGFFALSVGYAHACDQL
jgi:hypothetical protein